MLSLPKSSITTVPDGMKALATSMALLSSPPGLSRRSRIKPLWLFRSTDLQRVVEFGARRRGELVQLDVADVARQDAAFDVGHGDVRARDGEVDHVDRRAASVMVTSVPSAPRTSAASSVWFMLGHVHAVDLGEDVAGQNARRLRGRAFQQADDLDLAWCRVGVDDDADAVEFAGEVAVEQVVGLRIHVGAELVAERVRPNLWSRRRPAWRYRPCRCSRSGSSCRPARRARMPAPLPAARSIALRRADRILVAEREPGEEDHGDDQRRGKMLKTPAADVQKFHGDAPLHSVTSWYHYKSTRGLG